MDSTLYYEQQDELPKHKNQCYDSNKKTFYRPGKLMKIEDGTCSQRTCLGLNPRTNKITIMTLKCPLIEPGPGCVLRQNRKHPYPFCCPQIKPNMYESKNFASLVEDDSIETDRGS